jgi:hypothetical protein
MAEVEEHGEPVAPLFEKVLAVHHDCGGYVVVGDQRAGHHCFSCAGWRDEHPGLVRGHRCDRLLLDRAQGTGESGFDRLVFGCGVGDLQVSARSTHQFGGLVRDAVRHSQRVRVGVIEAADEPRGGEGGVALGLAPVELGVVQ